MSGHHDNDQASEPAHGQDGPPRRTGVLAPASHRFIALRWQLTATYHAGWSEAEAALAALPASQRAGIVDSQTGRTLSSQASYPAVEEAVRGEVLDIMHRAGPLGDIAGERGRTLGS